ncbi:MAG: hypothetical protein Rhirs2KO_13830 [Rhizobiaceae bacterium]
MLGADAPFFPRLAAGRKIANEIVKTANGAAVGGIAGHDRSVLQASERLLAAIEAAYQVKNPDLWVTPC